ncbi:MAG: hypothetical protein K2Q17_03865 [Nitrospiraceae bacterium]|jgi:hypothetical protein|uniref:hypothetical protein n=1 Tax=Nitrospira cf. moscoviensis SBR1015 TaxID=96242 RepID=UPI000A0B6728|nr:hypothetical protein [Nitrospira cf. moscoviensis SBR1015]MBY0246784.1 hypothetical protein [Nitrospiraceae bacterium]OQW30451.1 MAG: hypothetical protein A4E20_16725 [Nitrospira sp. SG-bin2]
MSQQEMLANVLPQFFPAHWLDSSDIVSSDFPSRIRIGYVIRSLHGYGYVNREELRALNVDLAGLHAAALTNLQALPSGNIRIAQHPEGPEGYITAEDNFAAVRILLPTARRLLLSKLGPEFYAVIPHRDDCFCWSPKQSTLRQAKHAQAALEDFRSDEYQLTPDILRVTEDGVSLYREQDAA